MSTDLAHLIHTARGTLDAAQAGLEQACADLKKARQAVATLELQAQADVIAALKPGTAPITEHRRNHRPGRPAILDTDPELRDLKLARIDRLIFEQIAAEIALQFPIERRLKKTSIHRWWQKNGGRNTTSGIRTD